MNKHSGRTAVRPYKPFPPQFSQIRRTLEKSRVENPSPVHRNENFATLSAGDGVIEMLRVLPGAREWPEEL